ncbi:hypothetical protein NP493_525g03003 [Ridgeia piscesae]|uniref:Uncharacterized protein n=1 Tax=Ridgeia piscesae TaxID=27915 RepID=A0AAD9KX22_RIDPI|nr:hypothetical protein NP493_525g03003 [Ridgeia piscesae]
MECVRVFTVLLVSCTLIQRTSQDTREKRDTSTLQPRIVTHDGHLVFETGTYRNITFKANEGGYIMLDGENIKTIAETVSAIVTGL